MNRNLIYIAGAALAAYVAYRYWSAPKPAVSLAPRTDRTVMPTPAPLAVDIPAASYANTWTSTGPLDLGTYDKQIYD